MVVAADEVANVIPPPKKDVVFVAMAFTVPIDVNPPNPVKIEFEIFNEVAAILVLTTSEPIFE